MENDKIIVIKVNIFDLIRTIELKKYELDVIVKEKNKMLLELQELENPKA